MSTTIILSSHSLVGRPPDRKSTQEASHWKLRLRSTFKSDINVGIKGWGGKLEQSEENARGGQERNASHRTNGGEARDDLSGLVSVEKGCKCWYSRRSIRRALENC
jgi:hypothetical protein